MTKTSLVKTGLKLGTQKKKVKEPVSKAIKLLKGKAPSHWEDKENKKNKKREARSYKDHVKREREKEQKRQLKEEQWLIDNANLIDVQGSLERWEKLSKTISKKFVKQFIRAYALADASLLAEDALKYGLGMKNSTVDHSRTSKMIDKILDIEVIRIILNDSILSVNERSRIMRNMIDKEFPTLIPPVVKKKPSTPIQQQFIDTASKMSQQAERRIKV